MDDRGVNVILLPSCESKDRLQHYHAELERLIAIGKAFVVVTNASDEKESAEETKMQALWFKRNLASLSAVCRAIVVFEPDIDKRLILTQKAMKGAKAFPIPIGIERNLEGAIRSASLIMESKPDICSEDTVV